ncbi:MAG: phosphoribosyltransferase [Bacteroidales bacterium]|jgi:hypothetical protein|nr:phosphoribosyltransferase [Bacteroidales bacterium]
MEHFTIQANEYLNRAIQAFYHADYEGGGKWKVAGTIENMICTLKNDIMPYPDNVLQVAVNQLQVILRGDLPQIIRRTGLNNLTVCVIPRAKAETHYRTDQLLLKSTIRETVQSLNCFSNGIPYIVRHTDTKTTHLSRGISGGGSGNSPYPGITKDTCTISENVRGKDILLIDDLYTRSVNIDEDAIQALLNKGAKSVVFYSVGKTVFRNQIIL